MVTFFRRLLRNPKTWQIVFASYWVVLVIATHVPRGLPPSAPPGIDKAAHATAFAGLAVLLGLAWQSKVRHLTTKHLFLAWLVLVGYAALDELTQSFFGRERSLADWMADLLGATAGLALFAWLRR
jgi:VanZ family protein